MTALTPEQIRFARAQFNRWLLTKERHEPNMCGTCEEPLRWKPGELSPLCVDVDHSALLVRLLSGLEPLPDPPPKAHGYPVYPEDAQSVSGRDAAPDVPSVAGTVAGPEKPSEAPAMTLRAFVDHGYRPGEPVVPVRALEQVARDMEEGLGLARAAATQLLELALQAGSERSEEPRWHEDGPES